MAINPTQAAHIQPDRLSDSRTVRRGAETRGSVPPAAEVNRTDKVEISEQGRALAERLAAQSKAADALPTDRVEELRTKLRSGAYDAPGVVEEVARRIAHSGDLGSD